MIVEPRDRDLSVEGSADPNRSVGLDADRSRFAPGIVVVVRRAPVRPKVESGAPAAVNRIIAQSRLFPVAVYPTTTTRPIASIATSLRRSSELLLRSKDD